MKKDKKHRKNCETALFKVGIVENVFCTKERRKEGRKVKVEVVEFVEVGEVIEVVEVVEVVKVVEVVEVVEVVKVV